MRFRPQLVEYSKSPVAGLPRLRPQLAQDMQLIDKPRLRPKLVPHAARQLAAPPPPARPRRLAAPPAPSRFLCPPGELHITIPMFRSIKQSIWKRPSKN
ncbi:hypothetical protein BRADI_1g49782v3 [Brachypodium distachyon]|uniref:Uncharacterized protein n=1 Tax=Brachypodium distachyon TaxID=15368 RepID=A0A2K2DQL7_BRADI|nr:hypothetical protein BRADI_1g49782v3 [Brachypodium distachyon]